MQLVAGVDSSTQSTKVVLRSLDDGHVVARAQASHPATEPPRSEQEPRAWSGALAQALDLLGDHVSAIAALSVAGQQHGLVVLDEHGKSLRPAKLWNDTTSAPLAERLTSGREEQWAQACGSVPVAAFTISKLAWLIENEPEVAKQIHRVMLPHDYLTWRLTGEHVTDRGDASGTGWFDPVAGVYRNDLLAQVVDDPSSWIDRLPRVGGIDTAAGVVTAQAASEFGLPAGIPVGIGTGDNMGAALGLALAPGDVAISLGTSGTVYSVSPRPTHDPGGSVAGFADATGNFLPLICTLNATKVTEAVAGWLDVGLGELSQLAMTADSTAGGRPVLLPYFDGERNPNVPDATGEWTGLRPMTSRQQLALSAFDGVICGLLEGLDALAAIDVPIEGDIHLIGGGAKSAAYRQRTADLTQRQIKVPSDQELVATGAAVQAAALVASRSAVEIAAEWAAGTSTVDEPVSDDHGSTRRAYQAARARAVPS